MDEVVIADGPLEVVVLPEAGARLHRLRAFGHDVLRTPDDPATHLGDPFFWGAYVMAPWCNRIEARPTAVGSRQVDLASTSPTGRPSTARSISDPGHARPTARSSSRVAGMAGRGPTRSGCGWRSVARRSGSTCA